MSNDLMVLDMGGLALPFDAQQAAELTKGMTAGFAGNFKRYARLTMGNSGDWELVDSEGQSHDMGREVDIVIVAQREYVSRVHYAKSFDEMKAAGEMLPPDCQSYNGETPDANVEKPYADKCRECKAFDTSGQLCGYYRRVVAVLANTDGTFSEPFIFEPKAKSLFDKDVVKERYGSYGWYMNVLASQKRNGVAMPIPTQAVVTRCMPKPKMEVATMKFGIASNAAGGYWVLNETQFNEMVELSKSDEVKEMLEPINAAHNNPSTVGQIPVKNVPADAPVAKAEPAEEVAEEPKAKPAPAKKAPPKKEAPKPAPKKKVKQVVLGMDHPDVVNSDEYDYDELKEWAAESTEEEIKEFLADNFPQALEPVEVPDDEPVAEEPKKKAPPKKAPTKKVEPVETAKEENVVDTSGGAVSEEDKKLAESLAADLDEFDD